MVEAKPVQRQTLGACRLAQQGECDADGETGAADVHAIFPEVVVPRAVDIQKKTITPLDAYQAEVSATRERADAVARGNGFDGLASMVDPGTDAWTEAIKNYRHANGAAGSIRMVAELASAPKK